MINIGSYVVHNTFPPAEGYVISYQPVLNSEPKIAVRQANNSIIWAPLSEWIEYSNIAQASNNIQTETSDNIIDAEFIELE